MKFPRNSLLVVLLCAVPILIGLVFAIILPLVRGGEYETEQTATRSFTLDQNFTVVRKILVRKDGAKQLVTMGGGSGWACGGTPRDGTRSSKASTSRPSTA